MVRQPDPNWQRSSAIWLCFKDTTDIEMSGGLLEDGQALRITILSLLLSDSVIYPCIPEISRR